ncbi:MAG: hypothetical protein IKN26_06275, partial [Eubacterium sp.]|nr:hypothetical protein [Eubacterium sp.]
MKLSKKILAAVLAALMAVSMMPLTAFADDTINTSKLATPEFDAAAYHYDDTATGGYSNVVYSTKGESGMFIMSDDTEIGATYIKLFMPKTIVLVYDGQNEVSSPIVAETKKHGKTAVGSQKIDYIASQNATVYFDRLWNGYHDSEWTKWPTATSNHFGYLNTDGRNNEFDATNNTSRFWSNKLVYHISGNGNTSTYYDTYSNFVFDAGAYYSNWGDKFGTGTISTTSTNYVINYKPIYDILSNARDIAAEINANGWKYTTDSLNQAISALNAVGNCNPKNYNFASDAAGTVSQCATDIKDAKAAYDAINLVKKTFTVDFKTPDGATTIDSRNITAGDALGALPANSSVAPTDSNHHNVYTWDSNITAQTVVQDDTTYNEIAT